MLGCSSDEGDAAFLSNAIDRGFLTAGVPQSEIERFLSLADVYTYPTNDSFTDNVVREAVYDEYFPDSNDQTTNLRGLLDLQRDAACVAPSLWIADRVYASREDAYFFLFDHVATPVRQQLATYATRMGAPFGLGTLFTLGHPEFDTNSQLSQADKELVRSMITAWSTYARRGYVYAE